jgi:Na+-driven multidrug efflux pump
MAASLMIVLALMIELAAETMVQMFSQDPRAILVGEEYLKIIAWNFAASGIIFVCSSMFQAMGNTIPSLITSVARLVLVSIPVLLLARLPTFELRWVWYLSVGTVVLQMCMSLLLLRREFRVRLKFEQVAAA